MKFASKFDDATETSQFNVEGDAIIYTPSMMQECLRCKWPTSFMSVSFAGYVCSEECLSAEWGDYWEACLRAPASDPGDDDDGMPF
jgi:hypothetical protein